MGSNKKSYLSDDILSRPSLTPENDESRCIALAVKLAEKQLRNGTASSQVITHYLKLASEHEKLERLKLQKEIEFISTKTDAVKAFKDADEKYSRAIEAMKRYSGQSDTDIQ